MKPHLILMSHGQMAVETLKSAQMIVGPTNNIHAIAMLEEDGIEGTKTKLDAILNNLSDNEPVMIIADLFGGTPCNVASMAKAIRGNIEVISGLNINMVIDYALAFKEDITELKTQILATGHDAIVLIELPEDDDYDE